MNFEKKSSQYKSSKRRFSQEQLAIAKRKVAAHKARAKVAFLTKLETDKKLDWI